MNNTDALEIRKKFGENIRNLRKSRRLSQLKFAEVVGLGVTQAAVSAWEVGIRAPDFSVIFKIANEFGVPVASLIPLSNSETDDNVAQELADMIRANPILLSAFNKLKYFDAKQISVVASVIDAIAKESNPE